MSDTPADAAPQDGITCPDCLRTSHDEQDVINGYCGWCHWWTSDPHLADRNPHRDQALRARTVRTACPPAQAGPARS